MPRLVTLAFVCAAAASAQTGFSIQSIDKNVNACENFYQHACGNWIKNNPLPSDRARWARFTELADRNKILLRDILETSAGKTERSAIDAQIGDYFLACSDQKLIAIKGLTTLKPELDAIAKWEDRAGLGKLLASLHRIGTAGFFSFGAAQDRKNSQLVVASFDQGGITLPDRDYYLRTDAKSEELRKAFVAHIARMFALAGFDETQSAAASKAVLEVETALAKASMDRVSRRNPNNTYHPLKKAEFTALAPSFRWDDYIGGMNPPAFDRLNVGNPEFFKALDLYLKNANIETLKSYLVWHHLAVSSDFLPEAFEAERFAFNRNLTGAKELSPRWKRCVDAVDGDLGEALGQKYVELAFAGDSKSRMLAMVRQIETAMEQDIQQIDWMGEETKKRALEKLQAVQDKIAFPEKWRKYDFTVKADDALGNSQRANTFALNWRLRKIGGAPDPQEWAMTPPTVNAYYSPPQNNINFPAGILQPPFFDAKLDDAVNYGGIGSVIGHELTHGFDDQGRRFDGKGNLSDWWTPEDAKQFETRADCFDKQYSGYTAVADVKLNGKLTLGENVADNGGVRLAYMAFLQQLSKNQRDKIDGYTPQQRFFLGFAQVWCENQTDENRRVRAQTDPHSSGEHRANGTVSNMPEFAEAFGCKVGQPMVRGENACKAW